MDFFELMEIGARKIRQNDDPSTDGLDTAEIIDALSGLFGGESDDPSPGVASIVKKAVESGLGEVAGTWIGQGENAPIAPSDVTRVVEEESLFAFAEKLGISEESARKALADALPDIVDRATPPEGDMLDSLLRQMGGLEGLMSLFGRMFR